MSRRDDIGLKLILFKVYCVLGRFDEDQRMLMSKLVSRNAWVVTTRHLSSSACRQIPLAVMNWARAGLK